MANGVGTARPATGRSTWLAAGAAFAVLWLLLAGNEMRYRTCITEATAKFPAVAVSAQTGAQTGPLKLSYDRERRAAVDDCSRFF